MANFTELERGRAGRSTSPQVGHHAAPRSPGYRASASILLLSAMTAAAGSARAETEAPPSFLDSAPQAVLGVPEYLELTLQQTSELWANPVGAARARALYTGLLEFGCELDLDSAGWLPGASLGVVGLVIQGKDLSAEATQDASVVSNIAGQSTLRLFTAWYEQRWVEGRIRLKFGIVALDDDFMIIESALLFVNSGFGLIQTLALNVPTPVYPLGALGVRLHVQPAPEWTLQLGVYDGDAGIEARDRYASELGWSRRQGAGLVLESAWSPSSGVGRIAVGGFLQARTGPDLGLLYLMLERPFPGPGGSALTLFAHASVAAVDPEVVAVAYLDGGAVLDGAGWKRPDDRLGLALAWTRFGSRYVRNERAAARFVSKDEWIVELTYEAELLPWIRLQPTTQWIGNAHFAGQDALAVGLRASVNM